MKKALYGMLLLFVFTACRKTKDDLAPGTQNPATETPAATALGAPTGTVVQKTIGAAGGSITSADGKLTFTVPAGALDANEIISVQSIENKAPLGMKNRAYRFLPHGLQFKKPAILTLAYDENDIAGSAPEQVNLATQTDKGNWKKSGTMLVNLNNRTMTTDILHFSDYAFYESFRLLDSKTDSDTAVIKLRTSEEVKPTAYYIKEVSLDNSNELLISVPLLASGYVREWTVNGQSNPHPDLNFGGIGGKNGYTAAEVDYIASRRAPNPNSITVTVKLDLGSKGLLFLLRNVSITDANVLSLNGKTYNGASPSAIYLNNNTALNFGILQQFPNGKSASVGVDILDIASAVPGVYNFPASEKVKILGHDEFGNQWSSKKVNILTGVATHSGNVEITVSGSGNTRQLFIKITGMLFGAGATTNSAPVNTVMDVSAMVF